MNVIVCLDDRGGMMFNHRRQSRDQVLLEKVLSLTENAVLRMNPYSARLFPEQESSRIYAGEDFLNRSEPGDWCFVENCALEEWEGQIEALVVFRWNRVYPADQYFDLSLEDGRWKLQETEEFSGHSHQRITMEVYGR